MTTPLDNVTDTTSPIPFAGTTEPVLTAEQSDVANTAGAVHDLFDGMLGEMPPVTVTTNDPQKAPKITILDPDTFRDPSLFPETAEKGEDLFDNLSPDESRPKAKEPITEQDLQKPDLKKDKSSKKSKQKEGSKPIPVLPEDNAAESPKETTELPKPPMVPVTPVDDVKDPVASAVPSTPQSKLIIEEVKEEEPPKSFLPPGVIMQDAEEADSTLPSAKAPASPPPSTTPPSSPVSRPSSPVSTPSSPVSTPSSPEVPKPLTIPPAPSSPAPKPDPAPKADPAPAPGPDTPPAPEEPPKETEEEKKTREANEKKAKDAESRFYKSVGAVSLFAVAFFASVAAVTAAITASWLIFAVTFIVTAGTGFGGALLIKQVFAKTATP